MNILEVLHVVGTLLVWVSASMLPSALFGLGEGLFLPWLAAVLITASAGVVLWVLTPRRISINAREGLVVVGLGWISLVLAGSLPFMFVGIATPVESLFESVSGFTWPWPTASSMMPRLNFAHANHVRPSQSTGCRFHS